MYESTKEDGKRKGVNVIWKIPKIDLDREINVFYSLLQERLTV